MKKVGRLPLHAPVQVSVFVKTTGYEPLDLDGRGPTGYEPLLMAPRTDRDQVVSRALESGRDCLMCAEFAGQRISRVLY